MNEVGKFLFTALLLGLVLYALANQQGAQPVLTEVQQTAERIQDNTARAPERLPCESARSGLNHHQGRPRAARYRREAKEAIR